ncbi:MAG: hypothetical protein ACK5OX_07785 [Desertimonas sp.]
MRRIEGAALESTVDADDQLGQQPAPARQSRRAALAQLGALSAAGALTWTAGVVSFPGTAAAAGTCKYLNIGFTSAGGNGWTVGEISPGTSGTYGFSANWRGLSPAFFASRDSIPPADFSIYAQRSINVTAGTTYHINFPWVAYVGNKYPVTLAVSMGGTPMWSTTTRGITSNYGATTSGTGSFSYTAATTGPVVLRFVITVDGANPEPQLPTPTIFLDGDDIGFQAPTVWCS